MIRATIATLVALAGERSACWSPWPHRVRGGGGVVSAATEVCDCPTCLAGDDQWCCRFCHDLARADERAHPDDEPDTS